MNHAIELKNFRKSFDEVVVHEDISFNLSPGECLGLIGGSGVGKSVILRSLIGLEKPDQGEIWVGTEEISKMDENELTEVRKKVAYVFQNGALFDSMTVFENLSYPLLEHTSFNSSEIEDRVMGQLGEFGLEKSALKFPGELSGGMQKRVGLARSIIMQPKIVLYDEPTAGLDPFNTIKIQEMIQKLTDRGVASIFVTHDMPSVEAVCHRVLMITQGQIGFECSIEGFKNRENQISQFARGEIQ